MFLKDADNVAAIDVSVARFLVDAHVTRAASQMIRRAIHRSQAKTALDIELAGRCGAAVLIIGSDRRLSRRLAQQIHERRHHGAVAFIHVRDTADFNRASERSRLAGATLFLEDVGLLNSSEQTAIMEWFDRQACDAVTAPFPVFVIAAADAQLYESVQRGAFREDLFYRLNTFQIVIPEWPVAARFTAIL